MKTYLELQLENMESFFIPIEDVLWFEYKDGSKCLVKDEDGNIDGFSSNSDVLMAYRTTHLTSSYDDMYLSTKERPVNSTGDSLVSVLIFNELVNGSKEELLYLPNITYIEEGFGINGLAEQEDIGSYTVITNNRKEFKKEYKNLVKDVKYCEEMDKL